MEGAGDRLIPTRGSRKAERVVCASEVNEIRWTMMHANIYEHMYKPLYLGVSMCNALSGSFDSCNEFRYRLQSQVNLINHACTFT